jgi:hypothetical protein
MHDTGSPLRILPSENLAFTSGTGSEVIPPESPNFLALDRKHPRSTPSSGNSELSPKRPHLDRDFVEVSSEKNAEMENSTEIFFLLQRNF